MDGNDSQNPTESPARDRKPLLDLLALERKRADMVAGYALSGAWRKGHIDHYLFLAALDQLHDVVDQLDELLKSAD